MLLKGGLEAEQQKKWEELEKKKTEKGNSCRPLH